MLVALALSVIATLGVHLEQADGVADDERDEILARVVEAAERVGVGPAYLDRQAGRCDPRPACVEGTLARTHADQVLLVRLLGGATRIELELELVEPGRSVPRARPPDRADLREGADRRGVIEELLRAEALAAPPVAPRPPAPDVAPLATNPPPPDTPRAGLYVALGGAVAVASSGVLWLVAGNGEAELRARLDPAGHVKQMTDYDRARAELDTVNIERNVSGALLGVGLAVLGTGVAWWLWH
jgi:hypothetical protein